MLKDDLYIVICFSLTHCLVQSTDVTYSMSLVIKVQ